MKEITDTQTYVDEGENLDIIKIHAPIKTSGE